MWHSVTMVNTSCHGPASAPCLGGQRAGSILLGTGHPASPVAAWGRVLGWDALGHCPSATSASRILGVAACPTVTGPCRS